MDKKAPSKGKFGDPSKLSEDKFSARAKRATLRGDDAGSYAKGGPVDGAAVKGKTKGKIY